MSNSFGLQAEYIEEHVADHAVHSMLDAYKCECQKQKHKNDFDQREQTFNLLLDSQQVFTDACLAFICLLLQLLQLIT